MVIHFVLGRSILVESDRFYPFTLIKLQEQNAIIFLNETF